MPKGLKLTNSDSVAIIDDSDYERCVALPWHLEAHGYINHTGRENGKPVHVRLHRFIVGAKRGDVVDHKNRTLLDCRKINLRVTTQRNNSRNRSRPSGRVLTSKFKGVRWHKQNGRWTAQIKVDYRQKYLGSFDDEVLAAEAYDQAARLFFGSFANLNFK